MHASDTAEITFENVRVPYEYLIGEEGKGFIYQMKQFQNERMLVTFLNPDRIKGSMLLLDIPGCSRTTVRLGLPSIEHALGKL